MAKAAVQPRATSTSRQRRPTGPICGFTQNGEACRKRGAHFCEPRANRVQGFIETLCVHTKGRYMRKPFILAKWEADEVVRPLFGEVRWSEEQSSYVRRYTVAWIEIARKNGKSELLAAIMLYLLLGDGEWGAELYGIAKDKDQATLVFDVARLMVSLSPVLSKRLVVREHIKRIIYPTRHGFYQVLAADAKGSLGSNPSGVAADEVLAWPDGGMWTALRTGMGSMARLQPLMIAATTAGGDDSVFAKDMHDEMVKVAASPSRSPHVFTYVRNTPSEVDIYDEKVWPLANPALGDFLSLEKMRQSANEARNDPQKEADFKQFHLNMWRGGAIKWMPADRWAATSGALWLNPDWGVADLEGRIAYLGLDLAAKFDLTAACLVIPDDGEDDEQGADVLWRFWLPEGALPTLDRKNENAFTRWAQEGWITITDGETIKYQRIYDDLEADAQRFVIASGGADRWSMAPVVQAIGERVGLDEDTLVMIDQTYQGMTFGMDHLMGLVKRQQLRHHGNPVADFCFQCVEIRKAPYNPELIRPDKPDRAKTGKRIDAVPSASMAIDAWKSAGEGLIESAYEDRGLEVV